MEWALRIKAFRRVMGYKQSAAAEVLGVSQATLSKWEAGIYEPTLAAKSFIFKKLSKDNHDAVLARTKYWIDRSEDRHALYNLETGQVIALSPRSRNALGLVSTDRGELFIASIVHESMQHNRENMEVLLSQWDKDVLSISGTAVMYDATQGRIIVGRHHIIPVFVETTLYAHVHLSPGAGIDNSDHQEDCYSVQTIYGDEIVTSR